jgi:hypothetical protein
MANGFVKVHPGQDSSWAHVFGGILWIVERKKPVEARVSDIVIEYIAVLVPMLSVAPGWIEVAVTVWVHDVAFAQKAGQGTAHRRVVKNLLNLGDTWQNIIADIAFMFKHRFELLVGLFVESGGVIGSNGDITIDDELLHLGIIKEKFFIYHLLSFRCRCDFASFYQNESSKSIGKIFVLTR